ncbi:zinc/iron permease [Anaeromyxobacter dehalogenans 2CP-1]|uniref:Zinc/iron permease n=1 Tax=Anaeromyxobacter dehalogenans (strain ATCC BAA-258 / DSM 21875 / 2CP-1) TaxID=455488 RepID=B8J8H2_ANAD2|nr:ZIP family metal transporter [Anaeromyxobacter dehalogenans]ACL67258.1 zinc/iron permease [Anaeromyxobacter dehalogenans 2CP-1]
MTQTQSLALYTAAILVGALTGGSLPLLGRVGRSDIGLSFSAGVMLGAAFFHMLPEAVEESGAGILPYVLVGFLLLFLLERFVLVHVCAEPGPNARLSQAAPLPAGVEAAGHDHHAHAHAHVGADGAVALEEDGTGCAVHTTLGLAAFVGMSAHTLVDGFALGAASGHAELGLLVFLAILAHKIPNSFSLSAILRAEGYSRGRALAMNAAFALMVPVGAGIYLVLRQVVRVETFTAAALAASAGTFLHLSLSDILPDLHRRGGSKWVLSGALLFGLAVMWGLRALNHAH